MDYWLVSDNDSFFANGDVHFARNVSIYFEISFAIYKPLSPYFVNILHKIYT